MPPKTLAKVGLITMALALLLPWGYAHWLRTRTFTPVDKPVLLEAGRIQTEDFEINLREDYDVRIEAEYGRDYWNFQKCPFYPWSDTDWKVYRLSGVAGEKQELWASSAEIRKRGKVPYGFQGKPGKYRLEWTVPHSASCVNEQHPQLYVSTSSANYEEFGAVVQFVCLFLGGTGFMLALRVFSGWFFEHFTNRRPARMFPQMELRNVIPMKQRRPIPLIKEPPNFGLIYGSILWILVFIFMILIPPTPVGLWVDFREQKAVGVEKSPWTETVSVYVDGLGGFLVNGQPVKREELKAELKRALSRQMVWTVYLEADADCLFMDVAHAMDTIQGLGAKLVWITPKTREGWKQKNIP
jgi:biopolymer transport protein ExbD